MQFPLKRALAVVCRRIMQTALRVLVTCLVSGVCLIIMLWYLGVPLPSANQLLQSFDGVSELARILS